MKILFIGKKNDERTEEAASHIKAVFPKTEVIFGARKEKFPDHLKQWSGDYVFSYLSPWIIPKYLLDNATKGAINWHPGPPEYPGIGCTNFAIYNNESSYGITCHYMKAKVDTGKVIEVRRFPVSNDDTVYSVTQNCYLEIANSFNDIVSKISKGIDLPTSDEHWTRIPYTRKELDALCEVKADMSKEEVEKRIKATTYDRPWAFTEIHGNKFYLK